MSAKQGQSRNGPNRPPTRRASRFRPTLTRLEHRAAPAVATWDGGGANVNWTTPANWVGDVAPMPGDDLVFPGGAQRLDNTNNFPNGTAFNSMTVSGLNYIMRGNTLSLINGLATNFTSAAPTDSDLQILLGLILTDNPTTINVNTRGVLLSGPVTGNGGLIKDGDGLVVLTGANTYTGATSIQHGFIQIRSNTALGAAGVGNETTIDAGASLSMATSEGLKVAEAISFEGQGVGGIGAIYGIWGRNMLNGPLTLTGDALIASAVGNNQITITKGISEVGGPHHLDTKVFGVGLAFAQSAVNTFTGVMNAFDNVQYNGQGHHPVISTSSFSGTGPVGPLTAKGFLSPSVGGLTTGDLDISGTTDVALVKNDYSRFVVHGTVHLAGSLRASPIVHDPTVQIRPGDVLRYIDNDGTDPVLGTFADLPEGAIVPDLSQPVPLRISYHGGDGNDVVLTGVSQTASAAGAGEGGEPRVNVYDGAGNFLRSFLAYPPEFRGGVHVATADINNDSVPDIITGAGPGGGPLVRVFDGVTGGVIRQFYAYDQNFAGGVFVAAANIFPEPIGFNQKTEIVTGAGPGGGPHVKIFDSATGSELVGFFAYDPNFHGGVSVAGSPGTPGVHGPAFPGTVLTGAGPGGGPHVRIFEVNGALRSEFFAFDPNFRGGVNVAYTPYHIQNLDTASIVTSPMSNGVPVVQLRDSLGRTLASFFAYDQRFMGGVNIAALPIGPQSQAVILTGAGPGGGPHLRQWAFENGAVLQRELMAFDPGFTGGVFVG